jgi:hypothetical protein
MPNIDDAAAGQWLFLRICQWWDDLLHFRYPLTCRNANKIWQPDAAERSSSPIKIKSRDYLDTNVVDVKGSIDEQEVTATLANIGVRENGH